MINSPRALRLAKLMGFAACGMAAGIPACSSGGGNDNQNVNQNSNDNDSGGSNELAVIDTDVSIHNESYIAANDDYIVFQSRLPDPGGLGPITVYDVTGETTHEISTSDGATLAGDFAISGSLVIIRSESNDSIYQFDAANPDAAATRASLVTLVGPVSGFINTDGGDIIAFVTSEPLVCWFDLKDDPLFVRTFGRFPENGGYAHVAVNGTRVAFFDGASAIKVQDTAQVGNAGREFAVNADTRFALDFSGGVIVYVDADSGEIQLIDVETGTITPSGIQAAGATRDESRGSRALSVREGVICGFEGSTNFGAARPSVLRPAGSDDFAVAPDQNLGDRPSAGWGTTCAISSDGGFVFIAGDREPSGVQSDLLSVWIDGAPSDTFAGDFASASDEEPALVAASDVIITPGGLVVFKLFSGEQFNGLQKPTIGIIQLAQ